MAKEIMKRQINPSDEAEEINLWANFGWELKDSREVYNKSSHLESDGDDIVSVTETMHFVTLLFQRDTIMKNYAELASLEEEYKAIPKPYGQPIMFGLIWLIITAIGLFAYVIPGVLIIIWRVTSTKKKTVQWEKDMSEIHAARGAVLKRCKQYI